MSLVEGVSDAVSCNPRHSATDARIEGDEGMDVDLEPKPKPTITVGEDLSDASVGELAERIEALREEIARCEEAIKTKDAARSAADAVFGAPKEQG